MAFLAIFLAWLTAGRLLRPLRTITSRARDISARNLHERLALDGPQDELRELGDTFDQLLERLEAAFEAQRRFVANASHELRTPLATMRAIIDVAAAKPGPLSEPTRAMSERLRLELDQVDRLLDSLLSLARAEHGASGEPEVVFLDELVRSALVERAEAVALRQLRLSTEGLSEAPVLGSPTLLGRLVGNVIDNAVRHNLRGGWIRARTEADESLARLVVENSGAPLDAEELSTLAQPFRRLGPERTGSDAGLGLGLSIVSSIAAAHEGQLSLSPLVGGGMQVVVELPLDRLARRAVPA